MRTMSAITPAPSPRSNVNPLSAPQKALRKLGLVRDIDLALHLPLRYEDETRIVSLRDVREGDEVQIEAVATPACCVSSTSTRPSRRRWRWATGCACVANCVAVSRAGP
jgi:ATP-dependent DNA helicase RecG